MNYISRGLVLVIALTLSDLAKAELFDRGNGLIYDDVKEITWIQDANYAKTSGYVDSIAADFRDGRMTWRASTEWAAQLEFAGYSDWRLPTSEQLGSVCTSPSNDYFGCSSTELGHLFFVDAASLSLFVNVRSYQYWSGTQTSDSAAYYINFASGYQGINGKGFNSYAWAVRDGDVAAITAVPEPETYALMLAGLGLLGAVARRRTEKAKTV